MNVYERGQPTIQYKDPIKHRCFMGFSLTHNSNLRDKLRDQIYIAFVDQSFFQKIVYVVDIKVWLYRDFVMNALPGPQCWFCDRQTTTLHIVYVHTYNNAQTSRSTKCFDVLYDVSNVCRIISLIKHLSFSSFLFPNKIPTFSSTKVKSLIEMFPSDIIYSFSITHLSPNLFSSLFSL